MVPYTHRWKLPDLPSAITLSRRRNSEGIRCSLSFIGEYSHDEEQAKGALREYMACVRAVDVDAVDASVSVKLTTLGALFDPDGAREYLDMVVKDAQKRGVPVEIDMEGRELVDFTLQTVHDCVRSGEPLLVAVQAYLDRTPGDLIHLLENGIRVRIVKGAYLGDTTDFSEIQERFRQLVIRAARYDVPFGIGTHDPEILDWVGRECAGLRNQIEIGFLKGLAERTKSEWVEKGWHVIEYVPYGSGGGAYEARRMHYLETLKRLDRNPVP